MKKTVISLGNVLKSDDNIGNLVVDRLKDEFRGAGLTFLKAEGVPENFLLKVKKEKPDVVFFVDASFFEGEVGDVKVFKLSDIESADLSTHNIPVSFFEGCCKDIRVVAIKVKETGFGNDLSEEMEKKFEEVVDKVKEIISQ